MDDRDVIDAEFEEIDPPQPAYGPGVMLITNLIVGAGALALIAWGYPLLFRFYQRLLFGN